MAYWRAFAAETVRSSVVLMAFPDSEHELIERISAGQVAKVAPTSIRVYDEKLASEANPQPSLRKCPHRGTHFRTCMAAALAASGSGVKPGEL